MTRSRKSHVCRPVLIAASACALLGAVTGSALADFPMWEDHVVGDTYLAGDITFADGVLVEFSPIHYPDGTSGSGHAKVEPEDAPCNTGNLIRHFVITSKYDFAGSIGPVTDAVFLTKHNGGIINLSINGSAIAFAGKWYDYDSTMIGGVNVRVLSGGGIGDCTRIVLEGLVQTCAIGLAEGWVDAPLPCERPTYDDLAFGALYMVGDMFNTDGIDCLVEPYIAPDGTPIGGDARVGLSDRSCGEVFEIETSACNITHDFSAFLGVNDVTFRCGEEGGGVNIAVNGDFAQADDWITFDGMNLGGCLVSVVQGGNQHECTIIELDGHVDKLMLGGEENSIDCIEWVSTGDGHGNDGECSSYDTMAPYPVEYHVLNTFTTDGILCFVRPQQLLDGSEYTAGSAFAQPSALACGSGQELVTLACGVDHRFADSIGSMENLSVTVADHGGDLNLEINGDLRVFLVYTDIDGMNIGGVHVTVVSGGGLNECTELKFDGRVDNILFGGGQHFVDCLEGDLIEAVDGDLNDDGKVDGADLAQLLGAWGNAGGDLNGDGITDGADLALLLGWWT
jgi:hypothetical protein